MPKLYPPKGRSPRCGWECVLSSGADSTKRAHPAWSLAPPHLCPRPPPPAPSLPRAPAPCPTSALGPQMSLCCRVAEVPSHEASQNAEGGRGELI